jgi:hypothetical protein
MAELLGKWLFKMEELVLSGHYMHYKNKEVYKLLYESTNPNGGEEIIVYRPVGKRKVFHRPKEEFFMNVMVPGKGTVPRFKLLEDEVKNVKR